MKIMSENGKIKHKIIYALIFLLIIVGITIFPAINYKPTENIAKNVEPSENKIVNNDLFSSFYEKAEELLQTMTLEEKIGQMFIVRFPESGVIEQIENYNPGGYILFGKDFKNETKSSILEKIQACQDASKIKLAMGVDEEGGTVVRVSSYTAFRSSRFLSPQALFKNGGLQAILDDSTEKI